MALAKFGLTNLLTEAAGRDKPRFAMSRTEIDDNARPPQSQRQTIRTYALFYPRRRCPGTLEQRLAGKAAIAAPGIADTVALPPEVLCMIVDP